MVNELPPNCANADFVIVEPFAACKEGARNEITVWVRVIRRVWSSGASMLIHQFDSQDAGSCGNSWSDARPDQMKRCADFLAEQLSMKQGLKL